MHFSKRSKMSITLSLFALLAIIGGVLVSGMLRSAGSAHAAATGTQPNLMQMKMLGTTQLKNTVSAKSVPQGGSNEIQRTPADNSNQVPVGKQPGGLPTTPPNPANTAVTSSNTHFSGFPGLNHTQQRLANNGNQFSLEPPDQGLCVGNGFILESVNDALAVYSTAAGHTISRFSTISQFYGLAPDITRSTPPVFGPFVSDPKCYYDRATQRWFASILEIDVDPNTGAFGTHSAVLLAVSQTSDPSGLFTVFSIDTTKGSKAGTGCPCFGDQPLIGADANGFYVSTNEFPITGAGFNGAQIYAISKQGLEAAATGGALPVLVHFDASQALVPFGGLSYSVQPATSPGSTTNEGNGGTEYFLSALDFNAALDNRIATWAITNTSSLASSRLTVTVTHSETYGQPPAATQKPGPRPLGQALGDPLETLNSNDDRMNQVVYANGLLFSGVNTIVQGPKTPARSAIAYFIVNPSVVSGQVQASIAKQGYVAVIGNNVLFPSIGVTAAGKGVMSFTLSGPQYFPSSAYINIDASGTNGSIHIAAAGALPEDGFSGYPQYGGTGVARWGDYSAAVADGANIWFADEYIPNMPRTLLANWGTFVGNVYVG